MKSSLLFPSRFLSDTHHPVPYTKSRHADILICFSSFAQSLSYLKHFLARNPPALLSATLVPFSSTTRRRRRNSLKRATRKLRSGSVMLEPYVRESETQMGTQILYVEEGDIFRGAFTVFFRRNYIN